MSTDAHGKWRLLAFIFLVSLDVYLDRINISVAGPSIATESGLSNLKLGIIFSAFTVGYGLFQVPDGWLGDRFGHKRVLVIAIIWCSLFTCLTPWAAHGFLPPLAGPLVALCLVRFLIGAGAAATYPCSGGLINSSFEAHERTLASGVMLAGVGLGSAATPPFIAWFVRNGRWRSAFYVSGAIGFILAIVFHLSARDRAVPKPLAGEKAIPVFSADAQVHGPQARGLERKIQWRDIIGNRSLWALTVSDFLVSYVVYIFFFWFYLYLVDTRGFSVLRGSLFTSVPFLAMGITAPLGGWTSDRLIPRLGKTKARRLVAMGGLIPAAIFILAGATVGNAYGAIACLALGAGTLYLGVSCYWATAIEIVPAHSATVSAIMNTGANLAGVVSPVLTPWVAAHYGWVAALDIAAIFAFLAAFLWVLIGSDQLAATLLPAEEAVEAPPGTTNH